MAQLPFILTGLSAGASIIGGIASYQSGKEEARNLEEQGRLAQEEAYAAAELRASEVRKISRKQSLAFLKSGVTLQGSPLLTVNETISQGQKEVDARVRSGAAERALYNQKAAQAKNYGRSRLISGFSDAFGTMGTSKSVTSAFGLG